MSSGILLALKQEFGSVFGNITVLPTLSASALIAFQSKSISTYGSPSLSHQASCEANDFPNETKFNDCEYCPRIKTFHEVFSSRNVSLIFTKNIIISLALEVTHYMTNFCQELHDADEEDRAVDMPTFPSLTPSLARGIWGSMRQSAVTLLRWIFDQWVALNCSASTAFKLLKDYRREMMKIFLNSSGRLHMIIPAYVVSMEANYTWLLADLSVSLLIITFRMSKLKDKNRWLGYWCLNVYFQGVKNLLQLVLSPLGAVVGAVITTSVAGALVGHNAAELLVNALVENAAISYRNH